MHKLHHLVSSPISLYEFLHLRRTIISNTTTIPYNFTTIIMDESNHATLLSSSSINTTCTDHNTKIASTGMTNIDHHHDIDTTATATTATATSDVSSVPSVSSTTTSTKKRFFSIFTKPQPSTSKSNKVPKYSDSSTSNTTTTTNNTKRKPQIYCDLDGVLVDFDYGMKKLEQQYKNPMRDVPNKSKKSYNKKFNIWTLIPSIKNYYYHLPMMKDGLVLWDAIQHLHPHILTGIPYNNNSSTNNIAADKYRWCQDHLVFQNSDHSKSISNINERDHTNSLSYDQQTKDNQPQEQQQQHTNKNSTSSTIQWQWRNMAGSQRRHEPPKTKAVPIPLLFDKTLDDSDDDDDQSSERDDEGIYNDRIQKMAMKRKKYDNETKNDPTMSSSSSTPTVITCWSINKHFECHNVGDILIDDRPHAPSIAPSQYLKKYHPYHHQKNLQQKLNLQQAWESKGGIFIHHISAQQTILELQKLGVFDDDE